MWRLNAGSRSRSHRTAAAPAWRRPGSARCRSGPVAATSPWPPTRRAATRAPRHRRALRKAARDLRCGSPAPGRGGSAVVSAMSVLERGHGHGLVHIACVRGRRLTTRDAAQRQGPEDPTYFQASSARTSRLRPVSAACFGLMSRWARDKVRTRLPFARPRMGSLSLSARRTAAHGRRHGERLEQPANTRTNLCLGALERRY
jgi:hypothetical protein